MAFSEAFYWDTHLGYTITTFEEEDFVKRSLYFLAAENEHDVFRVHREHREEFLQVLADFRLLCCVASFPEELFSLLIGGSKESFVESFETTFQTTVGLLRAKILQIYVSLRTNVRNLDEEKGTKSLRYPYRSAKEYTEASRYPIDRFLSPQEQDTLMISKFFDTFSSDDDFIIGVMKKVESLRYGLLLQYGFRGEMIPAYVFSDAEVNAWLRYDWKLAFLQQDPIAMCLVRQIIFDQRAQRIIEKQVDLRGVASDAILERHLKEPRGVLFPGRGSGALQHLEEYADDMRT